MIKEKELPKAVVSNKLITHKATDLTIMSYDKNVHKLIIPTDLTQAEISDIIVLITFRYHKNIIQISGELVEDKIEIILPNEIRSLSGEFYIEININLTDNRQITFARYHARVVKSDIDSVDLDGVPEFYFELFDDFVQKVADKSEQSVEEMGQIVESVATVSEQSTAEMASTVKQVADKSEVTVAEINALKQAVSDKADTATAVIDDASNSVTTAKQSALTSITQATSDVTDASTQFTADLADTQSTIDAQVTQAQDSLQEVSDTLIAINDTADDFTADVATKQTDVTNKYNAFDASVTQAGQTIDDILGLADDVEGKSNKDKLVGEIKITNTFFDCSEITVDTINDTITINNHGLANDTVVALSLRCKESGKIPVHGRPSGLRLFVINVTQNTFQLSDSLAGVAIDFTTQGSRKSGDWILDVPEVILSSAITKLSKSKYKVKFRGNIVTYGHPAVGITGNRFGSNMVFYQYVGSTERPDYLAIDGIISNDDGTLMFRGCWASKCALSNGNVDLYSRTQCGTYVSTTNTSYDSNNIVSNILMTNNVSSIAFWFGHGSVLEVFEID